MRPLPITLSLLLTCLLSCPIPALAFWGENGDTPASLNFQSGYDVNTVTTVSGQLLSIQTGQDRPNVQLKINSNGVTIIICTGPQRYWAENGLPVTPGDEITVRGSMAQGRDGLIYLMAQKITNTTQGVTLLLRNESGRPVWAGTGMGMGRNQGRGNNRPQPREGQRP